MAKLPMNVIQFAGQNTDAYEGMRDYFFHYMSERHDRKIGAFDASVSLSEKEAKMNNVLFSEIKRISRQSFEEGIDMKLWSQNPMVKWAAGVTINTMIEAILPDTIIDSIGLYTEMRNGAWGETNTFDIAPNSLFTVSEGTMGARTTFRQKDFKKSVTLVGRVHEITVYTSLYRVLCGQESLAEFVRKAVISIERDMTNDAYGALEALIDGATFPAQLKGTGFTMDKLVNYAQIVSAYNNGAKAIVVGTTRALMKVLPDAALGYRIATPAENMSIKLIKNVYDYDLLVLPQVATGNNYGLALNDDRIYIMSPMADKLIKGYMEGTDLTNSNDYYENADLTSNFTMKKNWEFQAVTNATMAVIDL